EGGRAVGRRLRSELGAYDGMAGGAVVDYDRLAERRGQLVRRRARQRVIECARGERNDVAQRFGGPGLCVSDERRGEQRYEQFAHAVKYSRDLRSQGARRETLRSVHS